MTPLSKISHLDISTNPQNTKSSHLRMINHLKRKVFIHIYTHI